MNLSWLTGSTNRIYYVLVAGIFIVVVLTVTMVIRNIGGGSGGGISYKDVKIEIWGVFDTNAAFEKIISEFTRKYRGSQVSYKQFSYEVYENQLLNALAAGEGPDVFMIHHTWLGKHIDKMAPMPELIPGAQRPLMTPNEYREQYVEVAYNDLIKNNKIYAMPLYVDTLALYYNRDLFNSAGITRPPTNWVEFNEYVEKLTKLDARGNVTQAGAALGTVKNINRPTDILVSMMIQSGAEMIDSRNITQVAFHRSIGADNVSEIALQYYTDFANPRKRVYTWNDNLHYSIDGFAEGTVAMMFNYSHQAPFLRTKNPRLNFEVAPMPQVAENDVKTYANYWALGVSKATKQPEFAWDFIVSVTSHDGALKYLTETNRPSARRDIIDLQKENRDLGVFSVQALTAKSWFQIDNIAIEKIFADMIEDVNFGREKYADALNSAASKINILMRNAPKN